MTSQRHYLLLALPLALALFLVALVPAQEDKPAAGATTPRHNPDAHARLALAFLEGAGEHKQFRPDSTCNIRFLSWLGVPDAQLLKFKLTANVWWNQMSFEKAASVPRDVPGSGGRLQWLDLSWFRWNCSAWQAVAERDRTFREPWVDCQTALALRKAIHVEPKNVQVVHGYHLVPVEAVVWAPQLLRDTLETDRTSSYYDLLFARQRHGEERGQTKIEQSLTRLPFALAPAAGLGRTARLRFLVPEGAKITVADDPVKTTLLTTPALDAAGSYRVTVKAGTQEATGEVDVAPGQETTVRFQEGKVTRSLRKDGFINADFPRTADEWDQAFGIDVSQLFQEKQQLDLEFGAIAEGGKNNNKGGSIVALNDRLLVDEPGALHGMRSFDVFETSGDKDFLENAPKLPVQFRKKTIAFDASELLNYLPNGGQAGFLTDGQGKRAEIAANKAADGRNASPHRLSAGVRNPGDCMMCHAPQGGYIVPVDLVKKAIEGGLNFHFKDPADEVRFRGFYLGWQKRIKAFQDPFHDLVAECTKDPPPTGHEWEEAKGDPAKLKELVARAEKAQKSKGWTSAQWTKELGGFREWYDGPASTGQLASELGVPVEVMKRLAAYPVFKEADHKRPVQNTVRLSALVRDLPTPRSVFDKDLYPVLGLLLYERREHPQAKKGR
jgi:hypothetical protein